MYRVCSEYVQSMFRVHSGYVQGTSEYVQSMFRVCSVYVHGIFRVCSGYIQGMFRVCSGYVRGAFLVVVQYSFIGHRQNQSMNIVYLFINRFSCTPSHYYWLNLEDHLGFSADFPSSLFGMV